MDGPAVVWPNGEVDYYIDDEIFSKRDFIAATTKPSTISINGKDFTIEQLNALIAAAK